MAATRAVQLGGYPAKKCPRVTHNLNAPGAPDPAAPSEDLQALFDGGIEFEDCVNQLLITEFGRQALLIDDASWAEAQAATVAAIGERVPLIINGRLPSAGPRSGAPDVLVLTGDGYVPIDIKHHHTLGSQKTRHLTYSTLSEPGTRLMVEGLSGDGNHRGDDCLQLAHYVRMLQDLGFAPSSPAESCWGGIIGTSDFRAITGSELGTTWYDLAAPYENTYSRASTSKRKKRSPLDRYDHEFAFRLKIAEGARAGQELVIPIGTAECFRCEWQDYCGGVVDADDASFRFKSGRLSAREWIFLREHGASTIGGLASLDVEEVVEAFGEHSVNTRNPRGRLEDAVERARMFRDGIDIEPLGQWPTVPSADVEVDFDIEWDVSGRIYQWGMRVRQGHDDQTASYQPTVSFTPLDERAEAELADAFADQLQGLIDRTAAVGQSLAIFHWSTVELSRTRRFAKIAALLEGRTFDLMAWMRAEFRVRESFSIKDVAPLFDFSWGVDDAGGYASLRKIDMARKPGPEGAEARQWCLDYNEADVAAQAAIRDGLRHRAAETST